MKIIMNMPQLLVVTNCTKNNPILSLLYKAIGIGLLASSREMGFHSFVENEHSRVWCFNSYPVSYLNSLS